jgi:hypothetical protein
MLSSSLRVLLLSLTVFLLGAILVFLGIEWESRRALGVGIGGVFISVAGFSVGSFLSRSRQDPLEQRREQRLWKSGPLGRKRLEGRRKIR